MAKISVEGEDSEDLDPILPILANAIAAAGYAVTFTSDTSFEVVPVPQEKTNEPD
jgi:hypothetical protein